MKRGERERESACQERREASGVRKRNNRNGERQRESARQGEREKKSVVYWCERI